MDWKGFFNILLKADLGYARTESALYSVYALAQPISSDVLILTDGNIEAIEATIASAKSARQRVFVIGLGSSASETHLRRLAEETLGACDFVSPGESLESVVSRMLERLRMPRITKLMILWPGAEKTVTPLSNAVFDKDTIHAFALLKHKPEGVARLIGTYSSQTTPQEIGWASFSEEAEPGDALPRMVASLRLHLSANNSLNESGVSMASLATDYRLLSELTGFLLVDKLPETAKPSELPELHKINHMFPAGWAALGTVIRVHKDDSRLPNYFFVDTNYAAHAERYPVMHCFSPQIDEPAISQNSSLEWAVKALHHTSKQEVRDDHFQYFGLPPWVLGEWLNHTTSFPRSYSELCGIGFSQTFVGWLHNAFGMRNNEIVPEQKVVESLLYMIWLWHSYTSTSFLRRWYLGVFTKPPRIANANIDVQLVEAMTIALNGITRHEWPHLFNHENNVKGTE